MMDLCPPLHALCDSLCARPERWPVRKVELLWACVEVIVKTLWRGELLIDLPRSGD